MTFEKQNKNPQMSNIRDEFKESDPLNEITEGKNEENKRSFKKTCCYAIKSVTVEPTMLFFVSGTVFGLLVSQNLILEKACRVNLNFSSDICDALKLQTLEKQNIYEREVQKLVAVAVARKTLIAASIPCIMALFVGSWSDRTGRRKIFIITPLVGQFLIGINGLINTYFFHQLPLEAVVYPEAVLEGLCGSWCIILLTLYSYISDITTNENRTFRMGLIHFSLTVGFPLGTGVSGILLKSVSYYGCYAIVICMHTINLIYNIFILQDPKRSPEQIMHDGKGTLQSIRMFFDFKNVKETFKLVFKKGENNRRAKICLMFIVSSTIFGPMYGEISIMYISTRYRFNWDELKFSIFQSSNAIVHTIGTIFSITVFSKLLKWQDSVLGLLSTFSRIAGSFVYCFAPNERIFFIAPFLDMLNGTALLAIRSYSSKIVSSDEFGKMNSMFALAENFTPIVYTTLYTKVYIATMEVLPGAVFLIGSSLTIPALVFFGYLYWEYKVLQKKQNKINNVELATK
ncbi:unnamed protein product [Euphydryas editha]|uniref:Adenylate cyclase n=1 Tax=Euphydryas editha TaxID=104508 RepID=A0AAU9V8L5_EUPED|nr:unnamed protein product [Euphydryas editha]